MSGKIDDFASSLLLFERMEAALLLRLRDEPESETLLYQLAGCRRKLGKLEEASLLYAKLVDKHPSNSDYFYTLAALSGKLNGEVLDNVKQPCAGPLVKWPDFLPENMVQEIIEFMCRHQADFHLTELGGRKEGEQPKYDRNVRNNTNLPLKGTALADTFRHLILDGLPDITSRLGLESFEASRAEVKLRAYHNGEYFRVHKDSGRGRLITYVYFFYPEPKRFKGGDLVVFDTDKYTSNYNQSFTRIIPENNSLFFFPSHCYHAVLPTETQDNDFLSARFAINGHIWGDKFEGN